MPTTINNELENELQALEEEARDLENRRVAAENELSEANSLILSGDAKAPTRAGTLHATLDALGVGLNRLRGQIAEKSGQASRMATARERAATIAHLSELDSAVKALDTTFAEQTAASVARFESDLAALVEISQRRRDATQALYEATGDPLAADAARDFPEGSFVEKFIAARSTGGYIAQAHRPKVPESSPVHDAFLEAFERVFTRRAAKVREAQRAT